MASIWKKLLLALLGATAVSNARFLRDDPSVARRPDDERGVNPQLPEGQYTLEASTIPQPQIDLNATDSNQVPLVNDTEKQIQVTNFLTQVMTRIGEVEVEVEEEQTGSLANRRLRSFARALQALPERCRNMFALIDRSGSQQSLFLESRAALQQIVNGLFSSSNKGSIVGIYSFSVYGQTNVAPSSNLQQITQGINAINFSGGGTLMRTGLQRILDQLTIHGVPEGEGLVIPLISDFQDQDPAEVRRLVAAIKAIAPDRIIVMALGVASNDGLNTALMNEVASVNPLTGKSYSRVYPNTQAFANDVVSIFTEICGEQQITAAPSTKRPTSRAPSRVPSRAPTKKRTTGAPVRAPSTVPSTVPSTTPVTLAPTQPDTPIIPPEFIPPILIGIAGCCCAMAWMLCCRREEEKLDLPAESTEPPTVASNDEPVILDIETQRVPGGLETTAPARPNQYRDRPNAAPADPFAGTGWQRQVVVDPTTGKKREVNTSYWTSGKSVPVIHDSAFRGDPSKIARKPSEEEEKRPETPEPVIPPKVPAKEPVQKKKVKYKLGPVTPFRSAAPFIERKTGVDLTKTKERLEKVELNATPVMVPIENAARWLLGKEPVTGKSFDKQKSKAPAAEAPKPTVVSAAKPTSSLPKPPPGFGKRPPGPPGSTNV